MKMKRMYAVLNKQIKDTLKNKTVLIQFVLLPAIAVIMENSITMEIPEGYFAILFATMYVGMAPLTAMSEIISEEKEKNTLSALLMANVKAGEYLLGVGLGIFLSCMPGAVVFGIAGKFKGEKFVEFMLIMALGILISMLLGAAIGILSRNQMTATSVTVPVMMVFSFLPMLAQFNDKIAAVSKYTYSQQISNYISSAGKFPQNGGNAAVILANVAVFALLFVAAYRRGTMEV